MFEGLIAKVEGRDKDDCGCGGKPHQPVMRPTPDQETIEQYEEVELKPLETMVRNIVATWDLPCKNTVLRRSSAEGTTATLLQGKDRRIKWFTMLATVSGIFVGSQSDVESQSAAGPEAFQLPANVPIRINGVGSDIWMVQTAASVGTNQAQPIYYVAEYWAD